MASGTPANGEDSLPSDRLHVFVAECLLLATAAFAMLSDVDSVRGDLHVCSGPSGSWIVDLSYWLNVAAGSFYLVQFVIWWIGSRRPWDHPNPISFSRQAWSGTKAWSDAIEKIGAAWRNDKFKSARLFVWTSNTLAIAVVMVTSALLVGQLLSCGSCPSHFDGKCTATIGAIAGSGVFTLLYYDMRIKFSGKPS